jgi:hypothetical protein
VFVGIKELVRDDCEEVEQKNILSAQKKKKLKLLFDALYESLWHLLALINKSCLRR